MALANKRILVTGGSGFIGSHLVETLVLDGADVTVVNRPLEGKPDFLASVRTAVRQVHIDLREPAFETLLTESRFDGVFHLAGTASVPQSVAEPCKDFENNLGLAMHLLELIRTRRPDTPVLFASSAAVYGNPTQLPTTESAATHPISPYGATRLAIESYAAVYSRQYQIPVASLRFFSVYGPRQRQLVVYDLINKLSTNPATLTLIGAGTETRDLIHVRDVARAAIAVLDRGTLEGEPYNVATGQSVTIRELAGVIAGAMQVSPIITTTGLRREGDPVNWVADISRIRLLGFTPKIALKEGIASTVAWLQETEDRVAPGGKVNDRNHA